MIIVLFSMSTYHKMNRMTSIELKALRFLRDKGLRAIKTSGKGIPDFFIIGSDDKIEIKTIIGGYITFSKAQKERFSDNTIILAFNYDFDEPILGKKWKDIKNNDFVVNKKGKKIKIKYE